MDQAMLDIGLDRWMLSIGASRADRHAVWEALNTPDENPREFALTQFVLANLAENN